MWKPSVWARFCIFAITSTSPDWWWLCPGFYSFLSRRLSVLKSFQQCWAALWPCFALWFSQTAWNILPQISSWTNWTICSSKLITVCTNRKCTLLITAQESFGKQRNALQEEEVYLWRGFRRLPCREMSKILIKGSLKRNLQAFSWIY